MFGLSRKQPLPIGVDLGVDTCRMLQFEQQGERLAVLAAASMPLGAEARDSAEAHVRLGCQAVRRLLRRAPFAGDRVVVALPRELLWTRNFRVVTPENRDPDPALQAEAKKLLPTEMTPDAALHLLVAGQVRQGQVAQTEAIALAARRREVADFVQKFSASGCTLASIDIEFNALYRSVERFVRRKVDEQEVYVLVDVGRRATQVVIGRGRELSFCKTIDVGGERIEQNVAERLGLSPEDTRLLRHRLSQQPDESPNDPIRRAVFDATRTVVQEIGRELALCLRYYQVTFRGRRPGMVRLVGGESHDAFVCKVLDDAVALDVRAHKPLASVDTHRLSAVERERFGGEWAVASGLALRLTDQYFGALDGSRRESVTPAVTPATQADVPQQSAEPLQPAAEQSPAAPSWRAA